MSVNKSTTRSRYDLEAFKERYNAKTGMSKSAYTDAELEQIFAAADDHGTEMDKGAGELTRGELEAYANTFQGGPTEEFRRLQEALFPTKKMGGPATTEPAAPEGPPAQVYTAAELTGYGTITGI